MIQRIKMEYGICFERNRTREKKQEEVNEREKKEIYYDKNEETVQSIKG